MAIPTHQPAEAALYHAIAAISAELALEQLLTQIVAQALALSGASYGVVGLRCERTTGPVLRIASASANAPWPSGSELEPDAGPFGWVLHHHQLLVLARYADGDPTASPAWADHALLALPLINAQGLCAVLALGAVPPLRLPPSDEIALALFAHHAAQCIANAQRFEAEQRRAARIALINRIGRLITSSLGVSELFQTAVAVIRASFGFAYLAAGIVDPDDPEWLVLLAHDGIHADKVPPGYRQSIHAGIVGMAARNRQRVMVNNVAHDAHYLPVLGSPAICAELAVPIIVSQRLLGVINIESERPIDVEEAEGIEIIADQFGVALENARLFTNVQRALETTQLLYATSQRISTAMRVEEVVAAYLEQMAAHGRYVCTVVLYETNMYGERTAVRVCGRWAPDSGANLSEIRLPYAKDGLDAPLDAGETVTISNVHIDPRVAAELRQLQERDGRPALALIPLMVRGQRIGLVILSYPAIHDWPASDLQPYQATAAQLATAIDSRQQHLLLSERGQQLAVLEERRRLARELHDSVTQSLFSMSLLAQVVPDLWEIDRDEAQAALLQIRDLTRSALAEMRALLFELRPVALGKQHLAHAIQEHAATLSERIGIPISVAISGEVTLPPEVEQALFRIAQEALTNVARHAHARQVSLVMQGGKTFRLRIADDGQGFQPDQIDSGRFGLVSMRERAAHIGATLQIRSAPDRGTEIVVEWPGNGADRHKGEDI